MAWTWMMVTIIMVIEVIMEDDVEEETENGIKGEDKEITVVEVGIKTTEDGTMDVEVKMVQFSRLLVAEAAENPLLVL